MYDPVFNSVLVQIDDQESKWGSGNDEGMLGRSFSKGTVVRIGNLMDTRDHPIEDLAELETQLLSLKGKQVIWNEGAEAGTVFDYDDKQFGLIYWSDIRGVLLGASK